MGGHLTAVLERATDLPSMNVDELVETLAAARHGLDETSALIDQTRALPDRLVRSGLLFAPARRVTRNLDQLAAQARGGYVPVEPLDVPGLDPSWRLATTSLDWVTVAWRHAVSPRMPERAGTVLDLYAGRRI